jgi:hypothetical protein
MTKLLAFNYPIYLVLIHGFHSPFMHYFLYGLLACLFVLSGYAVLSMTGAYIRHKRAEARESMGSIGDPPRGGTPNTEPPMLARTKKVTQATKIVGVIVAVVAASGISFDLGARYEATKHESDVYRNSDVLTSITIDSFNPNTGDFLYRSEEVGGGITQYGSRFCPDYIPAFKPGLRLSVIVYEDRKTCWSIADKRLGYIVDPKQRRQEISYEHDTTRQTTMAGR